jgi:hypothetical protein
MVGILKNSLQIDDGVIKTREIMGAALMIIRWDLYWYSNFLQF